MRYAKPRLYPLVTAGLLVLSAGTLAYLLTMSQLFLTPSLELERGQRERSQPKPLAKARTDNRPSHGLQAGLESTAIPVEERFDWQPKELAAVIGHHRHRHWGMVGYVVYSPDGKRLATDGVDGVRIWDASTMREVAYLRQSAGGRAIRFAPNGKLLAVGEEGTLRLWDATVNPPREWAAICFKDDGPFLWSIDFSKDSTVLAAASGDKVVRIFDISEGRPRLLRNLTHPDRTHLLTLSRDSRFLASWCADDTIRLWDLTQPQDKPKAILQAKEASVNDMLFTPDGKYLILATGRTWSVPGFISSSVGDILLCQVVGEKIQIRQTLLDENDPDVISSLALSHDGRVLAGGSSNLSNKIRVWDMENGMPKLRMVFQDYDKEDSDMGSYVALSSDGKSLATVGRDQDDMSFKVWDISGTKPLLRFSDRFRDDWFYSSDLQFSADGRTLACWRHKLSRKNGEEGGEIALFDLSDKQPRQRAFIAFTETDFDVFTHRECSFWFSPDKRTLAVRSEKALHVIQLWDISQPSPRLKAQLQANPEEEVLAFAFSPDGKTVATAVFAESMKDGVFFLWDISESPPKKKATLTCPEADVTSMAFSPKGDFLVTVDYQGCVRLWHGNDAQLKCVDVLQGEKYLRKGNDATFRIPRPSLLGSMWGTDKIDWEHQTDYPQLATCFGPDNRLWLTEAFWQKGVRRCRLRAWDLNTPTSPLESPPLIDTYLAVASEGKGRWFQCFMTIRPQGDLFLRVLTDASQSDPHNETFFLIDLPSGKTKYQCPTSGPINAAAISSDGRYLATANGNGTVYILQLPP